MTTAATPSALALAAEIAVDVAEGNTRYANELLDTLTRPQLHALALLLAAHVDVDKPFTSAGLTGTQLDAWLMDRLVLEAARRFRITTSDVAGGSSARPAVDARHVVAHAGRLLGLSTPKLGQALNVDHTTVLYGSARAGTTPHLRRIARDMATAVGWDRNADDPTTTRTGDSS